MANKKILNKKQGMHICNYYYIHKLVKEKNPTNIFYEETSLGRTTISTQNFRTFPRQNPQKSIFQDRKKFQDISRTSGLSKTCGNPVFSTKISIESFNEISLIRRSVNNSYGYRFSFWQKKFK